LEWIVRKQVERYGVDPADFDDEWQELTNYLMSHGGIEVAVKECRAQWAAEAPRSAESPIYQQTRRELARRGV
jgi:hypothetical protein